MPNPLNIDINRVQLHKLHAEREIYKHQIPIQKAIQRKQIMQMQTSQLV